MSCSKYDLLAWCHGKIKAREIEERARASVQVNETGEKWKKEN
jgi:hypothetical protein